MRQCLLFLAACIGCAFTGYVASTPVPTQTIFTVEASWVVIACLFATCVCLAFVARESVRTEVTLAKSELHPSSRN